MFHCQRETFSRPWATLPCWWESFRDRHEKCPHPPATFICRRETCRRPQATIPSPWADANCLRAKSRFPRATNGCPRGKSFCPRATYCFCKRSIKNLGLCRCRKFPQTACPSAGRRLCSAQRNQPQRSLKFKRLPHWSHAAAGLRHSRSPFNPC